MNRVYAFSRSRGFPEISKRKPHRVKTLPIGTSFALVSTLKWMVKSDSAKTEACINAVLSVSKAVYYS